MFVLESDVSHVQRLLTTDRVFFVTANLLPAKAPLADSEFPLVADAIDESRRRLHFLVCGYVLMPTKGNGKELPDSDRFRVTAGRIPRVKSPRHKTGAVAIRYPLVTTPGPDRSGTLLNQEGSRCGPGRGRQRRSPASDS